MTYHLTNDQLVGYIHQTLTDAEREAIDRHLVNCPHCRVDFNNNEALQRRIQNDLTTDLRSVRSSAKMSFTVIAPHIQRKRRLMMFANKSNQLLSGAVVLALFVALGVGVAVLINNINRTAVDQPISNPAAVISQPNDVSKTDNVSKLNQIPAGELKWKFETEKDVNSSPTVVNEVVYFGSNDHHLYAVNSQTGQELWRFDAGSPILSSPVVVGQVVYVGSGCLGYLCGGDTNQGNYLYAVNSQTGQEIWRFEAELGIASTPVIADGVVYFGSYDKHLYAVDSQTGQEKWRFQAEDSIKTSPAVVDNIVYFGSGCVECELFADEHPNQPLYALNSQTEQELWRVETDGPVESSPTVVEGVVYFGSHDRQLYAVDSQTGQVKWQFKTFGLIMSSPAVADGLVYITSRDSNLYAVDSQTGKEKWHFKTDWGLESSPQVVDGVVYFGSGSDGYLYAVDSQTGKELWKIKADEAVYTSPAIADGVVYFGSEDNQLYAVLTGQPSE